MGNIIRRDRAGNAQGFSFVDVEAQAEAIVSKAMVRAQKLLDDAAGRVHEVTEQHRREGYERGLAEGREAGYAAAKDEAREAAMRAAEAELNKLTEALTTGLEEYERSKRHLLAQAEAGLIHLGMTIGERVCKVVLSDTHESVKGNARALVEMIEHHGDLELQVHPAEEELLNTVATKLAQQFAHLGHVHIRANPTVGRGGCVLRTRDGQIDATIERQLERVARAICADVVDGGVASAAGGGASGEEA